MASKHLLQSKESELRIVLIGTVGAGKTSAMNTILSVSEENQKDTQKKEGRIGGQNVVVVDTPGLADTERQNEDVMKEIQQRVLHTAPGPHVFLFVLKLEPFTKQTQETVAIFQKTFSRKAQAYTIALFTHGNKLKKINKSIEEFIKGNDELEKFIGECQYSHVIEKQNQDQSQVTELLRKINEMVQRNDPSYYELNAPLRKKVALVSGGTAVAGAGVGGAAAHFLSGSFALLIPAGAVVGAVIGAAGILIGEHIKARKKRQAATSDA